MAAPRAPRRRRLSRSADFDRVYKEGASFANRFVVLHAFPRTERGEGPRLGVTVGRKVGGAVDRNKVKRALREAFWGLADELPQTHDFVVVGRTDLAGLVEREGTDGVRRSLAELIAEADLTEAGERSP